MRFVQLVLVALLAVVPAAAESLPRMTWTVAGTAREALVHLPTAMPPEGAPLVFVFHGHGGSMRQAARSMPLHEKWPEAVVVYPQGLPTPGQLTDKAGRRAGWQAHAGDQADRDLAFFDAMFAELATQHRIDRRRVYATGHSNGGGFTYLLWAERGERLAALAPSAALLSRGFQKFNPKPLLHLASREDKLVKFAWQERMLRFVLRLNGCGTLRPDTLGYTSYPSSTGHEVAVYLHSGGHAYPSDVAPGLIVKFFQSQALP
ncbi:esterase [Oleiharenicola lentus]|uniref:Esterase n=1 Tax=Oleiharenicola lentus TaxID=2508720 RepID=A0A4Q1CBD6_9BACT|nr:PHB depolymerase family esterase [Oleiharenicola lentus]RXK56280.1 esterase [Oleiharenicola lentus]